ncbi:YeeE/YedE family protein [Methylomonas sp. SURF-2]|uniref:YeeE/YedE family protein n=1 Tax=Methylomonas subterranea TaxID=2952225 RepID=A0ABT1TIX5_9GAMM|nr:YeeE/YedE family protein [Methylomonas sp. SURF-2]MCQ8105183.1 YeeE/YedE family protein [Methylomonas sp. SURF-2]
MQNFTPVSALLGGALIGLSAFILLRLNGRIAGISSIMSGVFTASGPNRHWRLAFLAGLVMGAAIWRALAAEPFALRQDHPLFLLAAGGFLVGFGTRIGNGCTSGHGICGLALLSPRSIAATLTFMASGMATVYLLRHVLRVGV